MFDFIKFRTTENRIIESFFYNPHYVDTKPLNNNYHSKVYLNNKKIFLHFRKSIENHNVIGYNTLDITISPHYFKNNNLHNGDVFTPLESIKSITEILEHLMIYKSDYKYFGIVNLEFGINIIPNVDVRILIKGLMFSKRSKFIIKYDFETFKISDTTKYKEIKAYAKGLQFISNPEYKINPNTFRFEVRFKQSKKIKQLGLNSIEDLLNIDKYIILGSELIKEWDYILLVNSSIKESIFNTNPFLIDCKAVEFWDNILINNHRNNFLKTKARYYKSLSVIDNLHTEIKGLLIDNILSLFDVHIPHLKSA